MLIQCTQLSRTTHPDTAKRQKTHPDAVDEALLAGDVQRRVVVAVAFVDEVLVVQVLHVLQQLLNTTTIMPANNEQRSKHYC